MPAASSGPPGIPHAMPCRPSHVGRYARKTHQGALPDTLAEGFPTPARAEKAGRRAGEGAPASLGAKRGRRLPRGV